MHLRGRSTVGKAAFLVPDNFPMVKQLDFVLDQVIWHLLQARRTPISGPPPDVSSSEDESAGEDAEPEPHIESSAQLSTAN